MFKNIYIFLIFQLLRFNPNVKVSVLLNVNVMLITYIQILIKIIHKQATSSIKISNNKMPKIKIKLKQLLF